MVGRTLLTTCEDLRACQWDIGEIGTRNGTERSWLKFRTWRVRFLTAYFAGWNVQDGNVSDVVDERTKKRERRKSVLTGLKRDQGTLILVKENLHLIRTHHRVSKSSI